MASDATSGVPGFSEAFTGLRLFLRGLPAPVHQAVFLYGMQRSGCLRCGLCSHSIYDCPHVKGNVALVCDMDGKAMRKWAAVAGQELLLFSAAASTTSYLEGVKARQASGVIQRERPPRRVGQPTATAPASLCAKPAAKPLPKARAVPAATHSSKPATPALAKPPAPLPTPPLVRNPKSPSRAFLSQIVAAKPPKVPPKASRVFAFAAPSTAVATVPIEAPPATPPRQPVRSGYVVEDVDAPETSLQDWNLPPEEEWSVDNTALDRLPCRRGWTTAHSRVAGDLEMPLRVSGRRRRATPESSPQPTKQLCRESRRVPGQLRPFPRVASSPSGGAEGAAAHSGTVDYEAWDVQRYKKAGTLEARGRFWQMASEAARERLTAELLKLPADTAALVQAKTKKWISA